MRILLISLVGFISILNSYSQNELVDANNNFGIWIYKASKPDNHNFFISPFSLFIALSAANEGANTTTRRELDYLLGLNNLRDRENQYNRLITTTINLRDSAFIECAQRYYIKPDDNELYLANSLWINKDFIIDASYKKTIEEKFRSDIFNFGKDDIEVSNRLLNSWVSEKTRGKIREVSGLDQHIMLNIINAIYFKGDWDLAFDKNQTQEQAFYAIDRSTTLVKYMVSEAVYPYFENKDIQSISIPYKCRQISMMVILPKEKYGISDIEDKITPAYISGIWNSSQPTNLILALPKFSIESEKDLKNDIIKMGYSEMFSDQADFSGISSAVPVKIGNIIHKTIITVNERGTEAGAVTRVDMATIGMPPRIVFRADHPFVFLIIDNRTDAILFMGRYVGE